MLTGNVLYDILLGLSVLLAGYVGRYVALFIKTKLTKDQQELLSKLGYDAVLYVQQKFGNYDNKYKLTKASEYISEELKKYKINLTPKQIEVLIESSLIVAKDQFKDTWK